MRSNELRVRRRVAIIVAALLSIVLFGAGLLSGLYVSKTIDSRQQEGLANIQLSQEEQQNRLFTYVNRLDSDLQSYQIQERFLDSLARKDRCELSQTYFSTTAANLNEYWQQLPARLEEYEQNRTLSADYVKLKKEYTTLSLRAWLISRNNYNSCRTTVTPVLYFYSQSCETCVQQGEILDELKKVEGRQNRTISTFTVAIDEKDTALALIKRYYNVTSAPAIIIDENVLQGRVYTLEEIQQFQ